MIAGALEERPAPDVLLTISEGLNNAAAEYDDKVDKTSQQLRALAIVIAAGVTTERVRTLPRPVSLIEELRSTLAELLRAVPSKNFRRLEPEGHAWMRALKVVERANRELGPSREW